MQFLTIAQNSASQASPNKKIKLNSTYKETRRLKDHATITTNRQVIDFECNNIIKIK